MPGIVNGRYFDPQSSYGGTYAPGEFATAPIGVTYLDQQPQASFTRFMEGLGYGGEDALARFARSQYGRTQSGYQAALGTNPFLRYQEYLGGLGPDFFRRQFQSLTPGQRGENYGMFAPRARWIMR